MATASSDFMVTELGQERKGSKLDVLELTNLIDGSKELTEKRRKIYKFLEEDQLFNRDDEKYLTGDEAFDRTMEVSLHFIKFCREKNLNLSEKAILNRGISLLLPLDLHDGAFIPTIEGQANDEQLKKWMPLARNYKILGSYAQTELGHGSNIRELETTATYDKEAREFIVDSPTLSATKFWPGALGHVATHAVVMARLITKGEDHGIHPFIVQVRSLVDHTPLPGITVGEIGPKMGYFGMDNGYLSLDHVRIPRDHMLMKYSQVMEDGTYLKPPRAKIAYGTMVLLRAYIAQGIVKSGLSRAVTIATRYSAVRRQGQMEDNGPEVQVLDYQTQQLQLFPLIAAAYALTLAGQALMSQFAITRAEMKQGNFEHMQEIHASTCGLKAFNSDLCIQGMETCRQACGGHGYSRACGIPDIYVNQLPAATYEGVNTILYLQTARYLNKVLSNRVSSSSLPDNVSYLGLDFQLCPCSVRSAVRFMVPAVQLEVYQQRVRRMVEVASRRYQEAMRRGLKQAEAWQLSTCDWIAAAKAHCYYVTLRGFREGISSSNLSPSNLDIVNTLCALFAVHGIVTQAGEFMTGGYMSSQQVSMCREQLYVLLKEVRREAVPLVDAFDIPDAVLNSVLGRYDGDVYTHLLDWAKKAPRNKKPVHDIYEKYLKELLHSKL